MQVQGEGAVWGGSDVDRATGGGRTGQLHGGDLRGDEDQGPQGLLLYACAQRAFSLIPLFKKNKIMHMCSVQKSVLNESKNLYQRAMETQRFCI